MKVDKLEIADELLETAIENHLDGKKYFASLHLAGAAQEIYGKWLRLNGGQSYQNFILDQASKHLKPYGIVVDENCKKSIKEMDNNPKNTIKHLDNKNERYAELNPENDSFSKITEAIMDYSFLIRTETNNIKRFKEYTNQLLQTVI